MRLKQVLEKTARITFEQKGITDDRRCLSICDFSSPEEIKKLIELLYKDYMVKKPGKAKCKLKVQILDFPTYQKAARQKKLEWSYWLYDCNVNVIDKLLESLFY